MRGMTIIELMLVIVIISVLIFALMPKADRNLERAKVARVRADMRSLAKGIEAYFVDHGSYPAWSSQSGGNKWTGTNGIGHINAFSGRETGASSIHSFRVRTATPDDPVNGRHNLFYTLTTPIAYISTLIPDPFADTEGAVYGYYSTANGWIVISFGPDQDESPDEQGHSGDLDGWLESLVRNVVTGKIDTALYDPATTQPSLTLLCGESRLTGTAFTYDPTNGPVSEGDVYRVSQR
jgi:prepilin-type N-terminal cleavage/methylation domain-containing protein